MRSWMILTICVLLIVFSFMPVVNAKENTRTTSIVVNQLPVTTQKLNGERYVQIYEFASASNGKLTVNESKKQAILNQKKLTLQMINGRAYVSISQINEQLGYTLIGNTLTPKKPSQTPNNTSKSTNSPASNIKTPITTTNNPTPIPTTIANVLKLLPTETPAPTITSTKKTIETIEPNGIIPISTDTLYFTPTETPTIPITSTENPLETPKPKKPKPTPFVMPKTDKEINNFLFEVTPVPTIKPTPSKKPTFCTNCSDQPEKNIVCYDKCKKKPTPKPELTPSKVVIFKTPEPIAEKDTLPNTNIEELEGITDKKLVFLKEIVFPQKYDYGEYFWEVDNLYFYEMDSDFVKVFAEKYDLYKEENKPYLFKEKPLYLAVLHARLTNTSKQIVTIYNDNATLHFIRVCVRDINDKHSPSKPTDCNTGMLNAENLINKKQNQTQSNLIKSGEIFDENLALYPKQTIEGNLFYFIYLPMENWKDVYIKRYH